MVAGKLMNHCIAEFPSPFAVVWKDIKAVAKALVAPGKGILAIDEMIRLGNCSNGTA